MTMNVRYVGISMALFLFTGCGGGGGETITSTTSTSSVVEDESAVSIVDDGIAPVFLSPVEIEKEENHIVLMQIEASDKTSVSYSIDGGEDADLFNIYSNGTLVFKSNPDYELPEDSNGDNLYQLRVKATDSGGNSSLQDINVTVVNISDEKSSVDSDDDFIPDNIERLIGTDVNNSDENNDQVEDGLQSSGTFGDNFFSMQWHLWDYEARVTNDSDVPTEGLEGTTDLNLLNLYHTYMGYNKGVPIIVQVVDTGVDASHEDLIENMDLSRSYHNTDVGNPTGNDPHGTMVAGIMAARAFNGKGVRGIIPFAKIAGSNWLEYQTLEALTSAWLSGEGADAIAVSNNSWGSYFDTDTDYEAIMELGSEQLRGGKGRIYVFAAGNDREDKGNANLQYQLSNRYAVTVAGVKNDNTYADYSSPGANILVSGYSGNYVSDSPTIGTTTMMGKGGSNTWDDDTEKNYTYLMNGTSAASPTVAASMALVLEACPDLTWRDIRYLAATTARKIDDGDAAWITNDEGWHFNVNYGFGLINAEGMIDTCTAQGYNVLSAEQNTEVLETFDTLIPDDGSVQKFSLDINDDIAVEWVEVTIDNDSTYASDYRIELVSPNNTRVTLMTEDTRNGSGYIDPENWMDGGFRLSTAAMLDESSQGTWTIEISDKLSGDTGTLKTIQLKIYGH